jgi:hypothetical protein
MASTVQNLRLRAYSSELYHLLSQDAKIIANYFNIESGIPASKDYNRMDVVNTYLKTQRLQESIGGDPVFSRRRLTCQIYQGHVDIDRNDSLDLALDPTGDVIQRFREALARDMDDIVIAAMKGNAVTVSEGNGSTLGTAAVTNTIDEDFGASNADLTVEKIIEARRLLDEAYVTGEQSFIILDAAAKAKLIPVTNYSSFDFTNGKPLVAGSLPEYMGFNFITSQRLGVTSEGFKPCLAFVPSALKVGSNQPVEVMTATLPDNSFGTRIFAQGGLGAVRMDDNKVVIIEAYRA